MGDNRQKRAGGVFESSSSDSDEDANNGNNWSSKRRKVIADETITELTSGSLSSSSKKPQKKKESLVIPLIEKNEWRTITTAAPSTSIPPSSSATSFGLQLKSSSNGIIINPHPDTNGRSSNDPPAQLSLEETAVLELLKDAESGSGEPAASNAFLSIPISSTTATTATAAPVPIIQQNKVPGLENIQSETAKFKHDVSMRPDECSMEDYEKIPVHDFGVALLRGMGWKDGMVVGKNQQAGLVKPMEYKPRPSLLGLGATPAPTITKEKKYIKPGEKRAKPPPTTTSKHPSSSSQNSSRHYSPKYSIIDPTDLLVGAIVEVLEGKHTGKRGKIVELKEKGDGTVAKLSLLDKTNETIKVWSDEIALIKRSPRQQQSSEMGGTSSSTSSGKNLNNTKSWLRPAIRVRIVSKNIQSGRYLDKKGVIQDVAPNGTAILRMDGSGDLVEECAMRHLETCVPSIGKTVVVVQLDNDAKDNKNNSDDAVLMLGATGKIVEKDGERERAIVQLYADLEIREFKYDDICESAVEHNE